MKTFQIITDSSCDLPQELADKLDLQVLPLHFTIGGQTYANYLDGREIGFHDFFERIRQGEEASTSAVNPESFREAMEKTLQQGLDILFIGGFRWGVWSAAVATVISQAISVVLCLMQLSRKTARYRLQWAKLRIDREMLGQIVRYGLPSGIQNSVIGFANVIVQANINTFGKITIAACGTYSKLEGFAFLPITSFTMALTTYTSQNLGAREYGRAKKGARFGIVCAMILAELIGFAMYAFMPYLARFFSSTPEVIRLATNQARTISLFYCLLAYSHAVSSVLRGAGKSFVPMAVMLAIWCVLRITYITLIMQYSHELRFLYYAYPLTWSISSVIFFLYYHRSDWVHGFECAKS